MSILFCRVIIPVTDCKGKWIADHFECAPYFAIFDLNNRGSVVQSVVLPNTKRYYDDEGNHIFTNMLHLSPDIVIVRRMEEWDFSSLKNHQVVILEANSNNVHDTLKDYMNGDLTELIECVSYEHDIWESKSFELDFVYNKAEDSNKVMEIT